MFGVKFNHIQHELDIDDLNEANTQLKNIQNQHQLTIQSNQSNQNQPQSNQQLSTQQQFYPSNYQ